MGLTNCCMDKNEFSSIMILNIAKYITSVLRIFGLVGCHDELGFPLEMSPGESNGRTREEMVAPYLDVLAVFRESLELQPLMVILKQYWMQLIIYEIMYCQIWESAWKIKEAENILQQYGSWMIQRYSDKKKIKEKESK